MSNTAAALPPPPGPNVVPARRPPPRWGLQTGLWQPRQAAFWLFVVSIFLGSLYTLLLLLFAAFEAPAGLALSLFLMFLYTVPFALVIRWLDLYEREPRSMVIGAFLWGALVATFFSGIGNDTWGLVIRKVAGAEFAAYWSAALTAPVVEEIYKLLGVVLLYLIARLEIDDLIDGFVYGGLVGLGFSVAEDIFYFIFVFGGDVAGVIEGFYVRVIASGLYGHVTYTGISGIGLAYFVTRRFDTGFGKRLAVAAGLLLVAISAHFIWNSPVFDELPILLHGVVKGAPFLIGLILLVYLARRREHIALGEVLRSEVGQRGLLASELPFLHDPKARRAARKRVGQAAGPRTEQLFNQLQREQIQLALTASAADSVDDARLHQQRDVIARMRAALWQTPGGVSALNPTADELAAHSPDRVTFTPTAVVGAAGAWAWRTPDQRDPHVVPLAAGLPLQVVEERDGWMLARAQAGWHGWTGRPYLAELTPAPPPPDRPPTSTPPPAVG